MKKLCSGKVRELYAITENTLLIVTTDRISAFDCILKNEIPDKGKYLNRLSDFWFDFTGDIVENHVITPDISEIPGLTAAQRERFEGRVTYAKRLTMLPYEFIVRGYMFGSMWESYQKTGGFCGERIDHEYQLAEKLDKPVITPSKKKSSSHDEYISLQKLSCELGKELTDQILDLSLKLYERCHAYALSRGIIIADTKFEFGFDSKKRLILGDEICTPDSSRFWDTTEYKTGISPKSFDKQFVRDWLTEEKLAGVLPAPALPETVVRRTAQLYRECATRITEGG